MSVYTYTIFDANDAIERSSSHNEIVTLDYDAAGYADLLAQCDDSVATEDVTEFWGREEIDPDAQCPEHGCARYRCDARHDGMAWRVHMRHAPDDAGDRAYDEARDRELTER